MRLGGEFGFNIFSFVGSSCSLVAPQEYFRRAGRNDIVGFQYVLRTVETDGRFMGSRGGMVG